MELSQLKVIESIIVTVAYIVLRTTILSITDKISKQFDYNKPRVKIIKKLINLILTFICFGILLFVWGVDQAELTFFVTSLLTVLGIAFFAQWSIISNITSTLIIFFNHPAKIGDYISIYDKEYPIEGTISDIGVFFVIIKTSEQDKVTIPSNVFIQKMIVKKEQK